MGSHIPSIEQEVPHKQPRQTMPVNFFGPSVYSKFYKALICAVVLAGPMLASAQQTSINNSACVQNYNAATDGNTDYFPNKVDADDATYFKISYHNNYKLLVNSYTNETFALYQCGTPVPTGLANGTKVFPVPVSNVAVMETIVVPYLEVKYFKKKRGERVVLETKAVYWLVNSIGSSVFRNIRCLVSQTLLQLLAQML